MEETSTITACSEQHVLGPLLRGLADNPRLLLGNAYPSCSMELHNNYWTLRHGQSKANVQGIIVSTTEEGLKQEYALTHLGKQQAAEAGLQLSKQLPSGATQILIYASPLSRTRETAEIAAQAIGLSAEDGRLKLDPALRERHFGHYELTSHENYGKVWIEDAKSPDFRPQGGGESVKDVADRLEGFLWRIESARKGHSILLVAHGDTLSILWALVKGKPFEKHREIALQTGELRCLHKLA